MSEPATNGSASAAAPGPAVPATALNLQHVVQVVRKVGGALLVQAGLHGQLLGIEWAEERVRLQRLLLATLLGFACLLGLLASLSVLWLAWFWESHYRTPAIVTLVACYVLGLAYAWQRALALSQQGVDSFAATRAELQADFELLRRPQ